MKENLLEILKNVLSADNRFNVLREYLQCLILKFVEESGHIKGLAFVGGTALRVLYDLRRFSEDLDFCLVKKEGFLLEKFSQELERSFHLWNIDVEQKAKSRGAVASLLLKFPGIMFEGGLSHRRDQKFLIKLEVDTNPPQGYATALSFKEKYLPMNIFHYDLPSLFAGKLHAVLQRQYTKGRDFYDLMWFLNRRVQPNLKQLENAIYQTTGERVAFSVGDLKKKLLQRVQKVDFKGVHEELMRFLEVRDEVQYVKKETLRQLIEESLAY